MADEISEPKVEFILGREATSPQPNLLFAKNPRKLNLTDESGRNFELNIHEKREVAKSHLLALQPDQNTFFSKDSKRTFARWLAARYDRGALPDALQERLTKVSESLEREGKKYPDAILGIYIDYDPDEELDNATQLYSVDVAVVFRSEHPDGETYALEAARAIENRFERKFRRDEAGEFIWSDILLTSCIPVSDEQFTLRDALTFTLWRLEHVSLRQTPVTEIPVLD